MKDSLTWKPSSLALIFLALAIFLAFFAGGDGPIFLAYLTLPFSVAVDLAMGHIQDLLRLSYSSRNLIETVALIVVGAIEFHLIGRFIGRASQKH